MPTVNDNLKLWDKNYDWSQGGDEWSAKWGGVNMQWYGTLLPRIHSFLPSGTLLEIAPGFGRWTQFLKNHSKKLILVDLSEKCINTCRKRFAAESHITYHVNDGQSLAMVPDRSVDFVFSFDSLVHVEEDTIAAYLSEIAKKLKPEGAAVLHHSNMDSLGNLYKLGRKSRWAARILGRLGLIDRDALTGNRALSVSAVRVEHMAAERGLQCISQEPINWMMKKGTLNDCITTLVLKDSKRARPNRILKNSHFFDEIQNLERLSHLYGDAGKIAGARA